MLGILHAQQSEQHTFSAAALASSVASKLGSAVFSVVTSFWGASKQTEQPKKKEAQPIEAAPPLPCLLQFEDSRRRFSSITLDPTNRYAACADQLGRVIVFDINANCFVRLWKGYRDVSCAWVCPADFVPIKESTAATSIPNSRARLTLFLAIFTAKRGILEIWPVSDGPRIAAFNVGEGSRMLYARMGGISTSHLSVTETLTFASILVLRSTGVLQHIHVPFSCSLRFVVKVPTMIYGL
jgi:hypothetical protein